MENTIASTAINEERRKLKNNLYIYYLIGEEEFKDEVRTNCT